MRLAVFRGRLTINGGRDATDALVDRLTVLGHDVLHLTAIGAGEMVPEVLSRDVVAPDVIAAFEPEAIVLVIPDPSHEYFPQEWIDRVLGAGGRVVYVGPAEGPCPPNAAALRFLAGRGFYFHSLSARGPQPIRSWGDAHVLLRPPSPGPAFLNGVYFVEVRTPYLLADRTNQATLLEITTANCCTWDGMPLPDGIGTIAAARGLGDREILLTGDWFTPPSQASLACNLKLIANLLTPPRSAGTSGLAPAHRRSLRQERAALAISADPASWPFVELALERLGVHGYGAVTSCGDGPDLTGRIPGDCCAFVPVIDGPFAERQRREVQAALAIARTNPDGFRIIPINLLRQLDVHSAHDTLRDLAGWVWLPGHDPLVWNQVFDTLVRVAQRPTGRFVWRPARQGRRTFISYSFRDHDLAAALGGRLEEYGLDVYLADDTALMNAPLREELTRLIDECDIFIPLVTPTFRGSNWAFVEAEIATERFRRTGRPRVTIVAPQGGRVPLWYAGFSVCDGIDAVTTALSAERWTDGSSS